MIGTAKRMLQSSLVRWGICLVGAGVILAPLWAAGETASADQRVLSRITADDLRRILGEEGYMGVEISDANGIGTFRIDGTSVVLVINDDKEAVSMVAAWRDVETSLRQMNEWNRSKKYSRAFLDKDGDPVIQLDLDLAGGVTIGRVKDFVSTVRASISIFRMEVILKGD
jgi:hypothetical protein